MCKIKCSKCKISLKPCLTSSSSASEENSIKDKEEEATDNLSWKNKAKITSYKQRIGIPWL